jgi:hypothetical protein
VAPSSFNEKPLAEKMMTVLLPPSRASAANGCRRLVGIFSFHELKINSSLVPPMKTGTEAKRSGKWSRLVSKMASGFPCGSTSFFQKHGLHDGHFETN